MQVQVRQWGLMTLYRPMLSSEAIMLRCSVLPIEPNESRRRLLLQKCDRRERSVLAKIRWTKVDGTDAGIYNVCSTRQGDTFVAKMRQMEGVAPQTYFREVGVYLSGTPQVLRLHIGTAVSLAVEVDGHSTSKDTERDCVHVEFTDRTVRMFNDVSTLLYADIRV